MAEKALQNNLSLLGTLIDTIPNPVFYKDIQGIYRGCNEAFANQIIGVAKERIIGCSLFDLPDAIPSDLAEIYHQKDLELIENSGTQFCEAQVQCADGFKRDFLFNKATYTDSKGAVAGMIGVMVDITERKQAEEKIKTSLREKEVLLCEIHHRVKNNMQTIISLLNLQANKIKDKQYIDMFQDSQDRIKTMSLIHEQLYQTKDFANIDFGEHVESLVNGLFVSYGIDTNKVSLDIDIKDVSIDLENAIPCGLIINELVSNSLKYAFPQGRGGKISIALRPFNEDGLELTVSDDGIGISKDMDIEQTDTMGLTLVKVLAEQLEGKIELNRAEGTQFHFLLKRAKYKPRI